jgi:hypothetical protein
MHIHTFLMPSSPYLIPQTALKSRSQLPRCWSALRVLLRRVVGAIMAQPVLYAPTINGDGNGGSGGGGGGGGSGGSGVGVYADDADAVIRGAKTTTATTTTTFMTTVQSSTAAASAAAAAAAAASQSSQQAAWAAVAPPGTSLAQLARAPLPVLLLSAASAPVSTVAAEAAESEARMYAMLHDKNLFAIDIE